MANSKIERKVTGKLGIDDRIYSNSINIIDTGYEKGTIPQGDRWKTIHFRDKNINQLFYIGEVQRANEHSQGYFVVSKKVNNTDVMNYFTLGIRPDGITYVNLSSPAAWRTALNTINRDGDILVGSEGINYKYNTIDQSLANNGRSDTFGVSYNRIYDKNNKVITGIDTYVRADGSNQLQLYTNAYNTSGNQVRSVGIGIATTKTGAYYTISHPQEFRRDLGVSRFHGSVTITDTNLVTITNSKIKANHYLVNYVISRPWNLTGQMTWTTYNGKITFKANSIAGNGIILYFDLMESEEL